MVKRINLMLVVCLVISFISFISALTFGYLWFTVNNRAKLLQTLYDNVVRSNVYNEQVVERLRIENRVLHLRLEDVKKQ